ncbi:MAG: NAD(P)H-binding protein [Nannocystaceae bacterium]|nr:NAD(P)H-binding protein [Nannocystaceae bacterium]
MKITIFGATGNIGRRVVAEALSRGHEVTALGRDATKLQSLPERVTARTGDVGDARHVATLSEGQDLVINATRPTSGGVDEVVAMTQGLMDGLDETGTRVLLVGGAATLRVPGAGGKTVLQDARFLPVKARHVGQMSARQYAVCRAETRVNWAYLCPPANLTPGVRTGRYRLGSDELLLDASGHSRLSMEDLAVVLLDEAEQPQHRQVRFTAAY